MSVKLDKPTARVDEIRIRGLGVSPGIVQGPVFILHSSSSEIQRRKLPPDEVEPEIERFYLALQLTGEQLNHQIQEAKQKYGKEYSAILESHFMILDDPEMLKETKKLIKGGRSNAEAAFHDVMSKFRATFLKSKNEYLRERAVDIEDVERRVIANLLGQHKVFSIDRPSVIVADTIKPSDIAGLERHKILAFVSETGSSLSHFAIVARSLNIPAVVGIANASGIVAASDQILIDGSHGDVIVNPMPKTANEFLEKQREAVFQQEALSSVVALPCHTQDGRIVQLSANVELPDEVEHAIQRGATGIGLYRTEYMLFSARDLPTEEEQYEEYLKIARKIHPHKLTMRTFDVGGDKVPLEILTAHGYVHEDNPFLGWRAIRIALECRDFIVPQIRAMLRLSAQFNIEIMIPMVISREEIVQVKALVEECKSSLRKDGIAFNENIKLGVMIETPAAALLADQFAQEVDFFSIGTNDLVQYTLATDRGNAKVAGLYNCFHPAVLQLLQRIIGAANKHNIPVAMCGEMASNPYATILLLGMGLNEFSVSPPVLTKIKKLILSVNCAEAEKLAGDILEMRDLRTIERRVADVTKAILHNS